MFQRHRPRAVPPPNNEAPESGRAAPEEGTADARVGRAPGVESATTSGDRMAIAGFVCSLCVALVTLPLVSVANMPSTSESASAILVFLLLAGAVLWVLGLVLSLRAATRASGNRKIARAGIIASMITPVLFVAVLLILLVQAIDWFFNDFGPSFFVGMRAG